MKDLTQTPLPTIPDLHWSFDDNGQLQACANRVLSDSERQQVQRYLADLYDIRLEQPCEI